MERKFIIIGAVWAALIAGFLLYATYPLMVGDEVELRLAPVDPTDILRGEYMVIGYDISLIDTGLPKDAELLDNERIYVGLSSDDVSIATGYWHTRPEGLFIAGKVEGGRIIYGIERFYIPEQSGRWIGAGNYTAKVRVKDGDARIISLLKDGEEMEFSYHERTE